MMETVSSFPAESMLSLEQQQVLQKHTVPMLCIGGAGTGKTTTLVARCRHLLQQGIDPKRILVFTHSLNGVSLLGKVISKALEDIESIACTPASKKEETIKETVFECTLPESKRAGMPYVSTLTEFALQEWKQKTGKTPFLLSILDCQRVLGGACPDIPASELRKGWKNIVQCLSHKQACHVEYKAMLDAFTDYKAAWNLADITDLLSFVVENVANSPLSLPWSHILVDHAQDYSPLELELLLLLAKKCPSGFFLTGNVQQKAYYFSEGIKTFQELFQAEWADINPIVLQKSFRAPLALAKVAESVLIQGQIPVLEGTENTVEMEFSLFEAPTETHEIEWIASQIKTLLPVPAKPKAKKRKTVKAVVVEALTQEDPAEDLHLYDMAILVRTKESIPQFAAELAEAGIATYTPEINAFWLDKRVQLILDIARQVFGINPENGHWITQAHPQQLPLAKNFAELDCPPKILGLGPLRVAAYFQERQPFDETFWQSPAFLDLVAAYDAQGTWLHLLNWIYLHEMSMCHAGHCKATSECVKPDAVLVASFEAVKEQVFPIVFIPMLEEGIVPFAGTNFLQGRLDGNEEIFNEEKEACLFYVGLSRASQGIFLSRSKQRTMLGATIATKDSRFLSRIPAENRVSSRLVKTVEQQVTQLSL